MAQGRIVKLARGLYGLHDFRINENRTLLEVAYQAPASVICLLSALRFHGITTQLPHEVWIALEGSVLSFAIQNIQVKIHRFSGHAFHDGIESHVVEGGTLKVYGAAKTIVDVFRMRNKVDIDVAIEALRDGIRSGKAKREDIRNIAKTLRMYNVKRPYMEAEVAS